jgi:peptidoglycan/xylan/chitin deacetylase (PgdA/CDA1 family)
MKKTASILCALLVILLAACNQSEETATSNAPEDNETEASPEDDAAEKEDKEAAENEKEEEEEEEPQYKVNTNTWTIDPIEDANEEIALVTIDDAPDKHAVEMAETLKDLDVNAIFFVNGHFLESDEDKEKLKKIHDMGFLIGNHTYSHPFLPDLSEEEQEEEIVKVNDMVEEIIGERPKFFRAPNGANTDFTKQLADDEGMILMNWTYGYDWEPEYQSEEAIKDIMINSEYLDNGANLLMHDREWTAAALHDIVTGLQDKGYEMVDPELIETKE